jgi:hypothetical protein
MQKLIEFYEMVSLNGAALRGSERMAILKARLALNVFERAMGSFKRVSTDAPSTAETSLAMAAQAKYQDAVPSVHKAAPNTDVLPRAA